MSIRTKLTIVFMASAVIPLLLVSAFTFRSYKKSLESNHLAQLRHITSLRADRIETFFSRLKTNVELIQNSYTIQNSISNLITLSDKPDDPNYASAKINVDGVLRKAAATCGFFDIMLIDTQGKVAYSLIPAHSTPEFSEQFAAVWQTALENGKDSVCFSDVYFNKLESNKPCLLMTVPAIDMQDITRGVIGMEMDMASVYKIIQNTTGLGKSGETLLGKKMAFFTVIF